MPKLLTLFIWLFCFTTFNRELRLFGQDLRYVVVLISAALILTALVNRSQRAAWKASRAKRFQSFWDIWALYALMFISCIAWAWNDLPIDSNRFANLVVLHAGNLLAVTVCFMYRNMIDGKTIVRASLMSLLVLMVSMIWVYSGFDLPVFLHDEGVRVGVTDREMHVNLFGKEMRAAGFAEDANCASLFCMIGVALSFAHYRPGTVMRLSMVTLFLFGYAISFSKTLLAGMAVCAVIMIARVAFRRSWRTCAWGIVIAVIVCSMFVLPHVPFLQQNQSMATRFTLWSIAQDLFLSNPILGGGLSSVRSAVNVYYGGNWYVQCHSTFWQVASEHGILALVLLMTIFARRLSAAKTWWGVFMIAELLFLCAMYEMAYQQVFVYTLVFVPIVLAVDPVTLFRSRRLVRPSVGAGKTLANSSHEKKDMFLWT